MAMWTPYTQEAASDLSNPAVRPASPVPASSAPSYPSPSLSVPYPSYMEFQYYDAPSSPEPSELYDFDSLSVDVEYQAYERDALQAMTFENDEILLTNNQRMRRAVQTSQTADDSYTEGQEQNNYTATESRDRRKLREYRLNLQETYLKKKIVDLRAKLAAGVCVRCGKTCV